MLSLYLATASNVLLANVLAIAALVVARFWRSPQLVHAIWLLVLLKLATPPIAAVTIPDAWLASSAVLVSSSAPVRVADRDAQTGSPAAAPDLSFTGGEADSVPGVESASSSSSTADRSVGVLEPASAPAIEPSAWGRAGDLARTHWQVILGTIWCAGTMIYAVLLARRFIRFRHVLGLSEDADEVTLAAASRLAKKLGLERSPAVRVVDASIPPLVWSLGVKPIILLPARLLDELDADQRDCVLAHELAHVRRRDDLVRWLEIVVLIVFWWYPVAWFARRKLREAEEECCDAWVVWALPGERRAYGRAMFKTIEFLTEGPRFPVFASSALGSSFYKRRIEMVMKREMERKMSPAAMGVLTVLSVTVLPLAAQTADEPAESRRKTAVVAKSATATNNRPWELLSIGSKAPSFSPEKFVRGNAITKLEWGQKYVIEFSGTNCAPCIEFIPLIEDLKSKHNQFEFISVFSEGEDDVRRFLEGVGAEISTHVVSDTAGSISKDWMRAAGARGIPFVFVVNEDSSIAWMGSPHDLGTVLSILTERKTLPPEDLMRVTLVQHAALQTTRALQRQDEAQRYRAQTVNGLVNKGFHAQAIEAIDHGIETYRDLPGVVDELRTFKLYEMARVPGTRDRATKLAFEIAAEEYNKNDSEFAGTLIQHYETALPENKNEAFILLALTLLRETEVPKHDTDDDLELTLRRNYFCALAKAYRLLDRIDDAKSAIRKAISCAEIQVRGRREQGAHELNIANSTRILGQLRKQLASYNELAGAADPK